MTVRTRFAPSPTGFLHIGGLRTALWAFVFARQHDGRMVLRIEDTDRNRLVPGAVEAIIETLGRMGIDYDEGMRIQDGRIVEVGEYGPYLQSKRLALYRRYADELLQQGHAYRCFCTKERLETMRKEQEATKQQTKYDRACLGLSSDEVTQRVNAGEEHVVRMRIPEGETKTEDLVYGARVFQNAEIDDQVILKSDGYPTYHLAVVVDDHLMEISHVIRGEDWISTIPKQIILYTMLGWSSPVFAHVPNLLGESKKKLSKRQGDVAVEDFLNGGILPEALLNFVATLGFNPKGDQEIYSLPEFTALFDFSRVNRSGAVVNREKLLWMNGEYLKQKTGEELAALCQSKTSGRFFELEKTRVQTLTELAEMVASYEKDPRVSAELLVWKKADASDAKTQLGDVLGFVQDLPEVTFDSVEALETSLLDYIDTHQLSKGNVLWPLRVALSGKKDSPSPFELLWAFGKIESVRRIKNAMTMLS